MKLTPMGQTIVQTYRDLLEWEKDRNYNKICGHRTLYSITGNLVRYYLVEKDNGLPTPRTPAA